MSNGPPVGGNAERAEVAHIIEEAIAGRTIQLNGVGKQVRDLLHATDLARLFVALAERLEAGSPHAVNVGGGVDNSLSIRELFAWLKREAGIDVDYRTGPPRPSDQLSYISDLTAVTKLTGWKPEVSLEQGLGRLLAGLVKANP